MPDGITDIQRNTPPWAHGMPFDRWMRERGWCWDRAEAERVMEAYHAAGLCAKRGKSCDWCAKVAAIAAEARAKAKEVAA